ncbi:hypothetical protein evm_015602 [Chilo suppressalis]|nr:hypothetical protein evm_015602 [Chilo suppressalis]
MKNFSILFWTDKKYSLKKIIGQRNADANRTGGGGPSNLPYLSSIEERMVAILGGRGFAEGDSQFTVPILPMPSQEPSTSTAPIPPLVEEEYIEYILPSQEDVIILPLSGSPDHIPPVASTQSSNFVLIFLEMQYHDIPYGQRREWKASISIYIKKNLQHQDEALASGLGRVVSLQDQR